MAIRSIAPFIKGLKLDLHFHDRIQSLNRFATNDTLQYKNAYYTLGSQNICYSLYMASLYIGCCGRRKKTTEEREKGPCPREYHHPFSSSFVLDLALTPKHVHETSLTAKTTHTGG